MWTTAVFVVDEMLPNFWLNEPMPPSMRAEAGLPPSAPVLVTMLMTPPTALSPYRTAPLLPRVTSMRSMDCNGMVDRSTPARSISLIRRPFTRDQRIGGRERAEATQIDCGACAVYPAIKRLQLDASHRAQHVLHRLARRPLDVVRGNDTGRSSRDIVGFD